MRNKFLPAPALAAFLAVVIPVGLVAQEEGSNTWMPYTGEDRLRGILSDAVMEGTLTNGVTATGRYNNDGTGVLNAWGESFTRTWRIEDDNKICIRYAREQACLTLEKAEGKENVFRATRIGTGETAVFTINSDSDRIEVDAKNEGLGGAAEPSAEEVAKSLANPNTPLASQTLKFQYRQFDGELPGADRQNGTMLLYQPTFPFPLDNGATVFIRPAIPMIFEQPVFDPHSNDFDSADGLGDIGFDLAYGRTTESGLLWAVGMVATLPTATEDELGPDRFNLGPELLIGKTIDRVVLGALTTYQTGVGGSGDTDVSVTTVNAFATYLPGGGWNVGSAPIMSYDHENSQWTLPINLSFGKTVIWKGRPWKLGAEINYYVDQPDAFGPDWMIGLNVAPVVENVFAKMLQ